MIIDYTDSYISDSLESLVAIISTCTIWLCNELRYLIHSVNDICFIQLDYRCIQIQVYMYMYWLYKYTSLQGARLHEGQSGNKFQRRIYRMYSILYVLRYFKSDV